MSDLVDYLQRQGQIAQFGDQIVGARFTDIAEAFHYGLNTYSLTTVLSGTGTAEVVSSVLTLSSGAGTGAARSETKRFLRYQSGFDGYAYFTAAFSVGDAGSYQRICLFDENNGYWLGQEGGTFYAARRSSGVDEKVEIGFAAGGAHFDPTKMNAFRFSYGWLGVLPGVFEYWDAHPRTWRELAILSIAGESDGVSVLQPNQPMAAEVGRTSGSGAVTLKTASWSAGRVQSAQISSPADRRFAANSSKTGVTTEINVITLKAATTFQSLENHIVVELDFLSMASEGAKPVTFYVKRNSTLGGTPNYTERDATNSVMSFDTGGTTVTGGTQEYAFALAKADSKQIDTIALTIYPGDTITISATSANATDVSVGVRWRELF